MKQKLQYNRVYKWLYYYAMQVSVSILVLKIAQDDIWWLYWIFYNYMVA